MIMCAPPQFAGVQMYEMNNNRKRREKKTKKEIKIEEANEHVIMPLVKCRQSTNNNDYDRDFLLLLYFIIFYFVFRKKKKGFAIIAKRVWLLYSV